MNRIPVDAAALGDMRFLGAEQRTDRQGTPILRDGTPVQRASILITPPDGRKEVILVDVTRTQPITGKEYGHARIMNLTARPWNMDGRDGITYTADDITITDTDTKSDKTGNSGTKPTDDAAKPLASSPKPFGLK